MIYTQLTKNGGKGNPAMDELSKPAVGFATDTKVVTYYRNGVRYSLKYKSKNDTAYDFGTIQNWIKEFYPSATVNSFTGNSTSVDTEGYRTAYFTNPITMLGVKGDASSITDIGAIVGFPAEDISQAPPITEVIIPNTVTELSTDAQLVMGGFMYFMELTAITIPSSVTTIDPYTFMACSKLQSLTIPNSVTSIGEGCFSSCISLTSLTLPSGATINTNGLCNGCHALTSIVLPNIVTTIGDEAFKNCRALTSVTLPSNLTTIGDEAFRNCLSLTTIALPNTVTTIGDSAFRSNSNFTSMTFPASVTSLGNLLFNNSENMTSITFLGTTPPSIVADSLYISPTNNCDIYVPSSALQTYRTAWSQYGTDLTNRLKGN